jgi:hypothetical protein
MEIRIKQEKIVAGLPKFISLSLSLSLSLSRSLSLSLSKIFSQLSILLRT